MYDESKPKNYYQSPIKGHLFREGTRPSLYFENETLPKTYSKTVTSESRVSFAQVIFAVSEIANSFRVKWVKEQLLRDNEFAKLIKKDELEREYLIYGEYKAWALKNKGKLQLRTLKGKEIDLWLLGL